MIGTPTASSVPRLRAHRLIASLVNSEPNTGSFSLRRSTLSRKFLLVRMAFLNALRPKKAPPSMIGRIQYMLCDSVTMIWVGSGSLPPSCLNIFSNIGTMNMITPVPRSSEKISTMTG